VTLRTLVGSIVAAVVLTAVLGFGYPALMTGIGQLAFSHEANGSLVRVDGRVVGSELAGQAFARPRYFHPRPTATAPPYDAAGTTFANLGPTNPELLTAVEARIRAYRRENRLAPTTPVPVDAVTASGSGLDPHISPANARLQAPRVARARGLATTAVLALVRAHTDGRSLGFLGEPGVNVLELNLALDSA
jgi:K+-transporting ATPase ATPase C chain